MNAEMILETLGVWAATSSAILILAWLGTLSVRKNAALRHMIWATAFGLLLMSPIIGHFVPGRVSPATPAAAIETYAVTEIPDDVVLTPEVPTPMFNWRPVIAGAIGLWALGTVLILGKAAFGIKQANQMRKEGLPGDPNLLGTSEKLGLKRAWELRVSSTKRPPAAMTWGSLKPVVILPQASSEWDEKRTDTVLLHELSHVCRYDSLTQLLALSMCAVYWFNPLVWLAARALRADAEQAADDRVIRAGVKPSDYAEELLRLAAEFGQQRQPLTHIGVSIMKQSQIETRILSIVDPSKRRRGVARLEGFSVVTVGLVAALGLISLRPAMAQVKDQTPPPTPPKVEEKQVPPAPPAVVKEYPVEYSAPPSKAQAKKAGTKKQLPKRTTKVKEVPIKILPPRETAVTYSVELPKQGKGDVKPTKTITYTTQAKFTKVSPKVAYTTSVQGTKYTTRVVPVYTTSSQALTYTRAVKPLKYSVITKPTYTTTAKYRVDLSKVHPSYTVTTKTLPYKVVPPTQGSQDREKQEEKARQDQVRDKKAAEERAQTRNMSEEQKRKAEAEISVVQARQDKMTDQQRREAELAVVRAKQLQTSDQVRRDVEVAVVKAQKDKMMSDKERRAVEISVQKALKSSKSKGKMTKDQQRKAEAEVRALKEQLAKRNREVDRVIAEKRQLEKELARAKQAKGSAEAERRMVEELRSRKENAAQNNRLSDVERERLMKLEKERADIARAAKAEKERRDREEAAKNKKKDGGS